MSDEAKPGAKPDFVADNRKLQAFKDWVHAYLDDKGVPHHPYGVHGAAGCRIGDRLDWVFAHIGVSRGPDHEKTQTE